MSDAIHADGVEPNVLLISSDAFAALRGPSKRDIHKAARRLVRATRASYWTCVRSLNYRMRGQGMTLPQAEAACVHPSKRVDH